MPGRKFLEILCFGGLLVLQNPSASGQQCIWARQISGPSAQTELLGIQSNGEKILINGRSDKVVRIGRKTIPIASGKENFGLVFSEDGEFGEAEPAGSDQPEKKSPESDYAWVMRTNVRNGNYFLAYGLSTPLRIPENLAWTLAYLDGSGHRLWEMPLPDKNTIRQIRLLRNGQCLLVGKEMRTEGDSQIWISVWNEYGKEVWKKTMGGVYEDEALTCTEDKEGTLFVGGFFTADTTFLGNSRDLSGNDRDGFIAAFEKTGQERFLQRQRGQGWNEVRLLEASPMGNILFGATFSGSDWRLGNFGLKREGSQDVVVGMIDPRISRKRDEYLRIFPNPAREIVYFGFDRVWEKGKKQVRLERKDGTVLQEMEITGLPGSSYRFNVSNTEPGVYFLVVRKAGKSLKEMVRVE